jgi:hypothetical protein
MELLDNIFVSSIVSLIFITLLNIVELNQQILLFLTLFVLLLFKTYIENNQKEKEQIIHTIKQQQMNTIKQQQMNTIKQQQMNTIKQSNNLILSSNNKNFLNFIKIKKTNNAKQTNQPNQTNQTIQTNQIIQPIQTIQTNQPKYYPLKMKDNLTLSKLNEQNDYITRDCIDDGTCLM